MAGAGGSPRVSGAGEEAQVWVDFQFSPLLLLLEAPRVAVWFLASLNGLGFWDCLVQVWSWGQSAEERP